MMAKGVLLCMTLMSLALFCLAKLPPQQLAFDVCKGVGDKSGCSGCESPVVDCEWCTNPLDSSDGICAPEGWCSLAKATFVPNSNVCPSDPKKEPKYDGEYVTSTKALIFSAFHESHYCEFPIQPWPVDRSANPIGTSAGDPIQNCRAANNFLATGQRVGIQSCVPGGQLTQKHLECIRTYQSFLCTTLCPKYGEPMNFKKLCPEVLDRLYQHCDASIIDCVHNYIDLRDYLARAGPNDPTCFSPNLTRASGKFEYDMCFFGDPSRCKSLDCIVELSTDPWPAKFRAGASYMFLGGDTDEANYVASQSGPCCNFGNYKSNGVIDDWGIGLLYKIISEPAAGGKDCKTAVVEAAQTNGAWKQYVTSYDITGRPSGPTNGVPCTGSKAGDYCAIQVEVDDAPQNAFPSTCSIPGKVNDCPAVLEWID